MDRSRLAIIIPALNEEASIGGIVRQCREYGVPIVVDDGSSDQTGHIAKREGASVVRHDNNMGYDQALNSGFCRASDLDFDFVITIDADGQHSPDLIEKFVELLNDGVDVVIGSRDKKARFFECVFAFFTRRLYGISDPLCGLKGYRMSVYRALGHFDSYSSIGTELALFSVRSGFRISEVPFAVGERDGHPRFGRVLYSNYKIFRAIYLLFFKRCCLYSTKNASFR